MDALAYMSPETALPTFLFFYHLSLKTLLVWFLFKIDADSSV